MSRRFYLLAGLVWALGLAAFLLLPARGIPPAAYGIVVLLAALGMAADSFAFQVPGRGSVSLSFAVILCTLLIAGPVAGMLVAAASGVTLQDIRQRKPPSIVGFNIGQLAFSALVGGHVLLVLGQPAWITLGVSEVGTIWRLLSALVAATAVHAVNIVLMGTGFALVERVQLPAVFRQLRFTDYFVSFAVLALLGVLLAQLLLAAGVFGALLLLVPFAVARQTFQVYSQLADAFADTLRSLVAAVEAKDVYTRGHSERVAAYSRRLAERSGLSTAAVDRVEIAALLHDVGKLGISASVLSKTTPLDADEVTTIRAHPETGRRILQSVEFVSDLAPIVAAHHERIDGSGYPLGLRGEEIPFEARILAVADTYDAMSSSRPYRGALSHEVVLAELESVAGKQLDGLLVRKMVDEVIATADTRAGGDGP